MVPLARALSAQGHTVAWAVAANVHPLLRSQGFECMAVGPDRAWATAELSRQWPERASLPALRVVAELGPRLFADVLAPATLPALLDCAQAWRPDMVVHDVMGHAAPLVAARLGLRSVSHGFGLPRPRSSIEGVEQRMAPVWHAHGLVMPPDGGNHRGGHVDLCPPSMRLEEALPEGPCWLQSPTSGVHRRVGERAGVLASFGTVHHQQAAFDRLLNVLRKGPWPARVGLGRSLDAPQQWPAHVHAAPWLDLAIEWATCRVGACHGGAGTMLGALAQGVPLLLLPVAADQFRNARALQAVGAGISLQGDAQTESEMRHALERLHDEPAFTDAALRMADELAAMPQAEDVARALLR